MRPTHPLPIILALCGFAGVSVFLLHPKPGVQLEGEVAMLDPSAALQRLDDAPNTVRSGRNLALTHAALALDGGEFHVAETVLKELQADGQNSSDIELMLADASRLSGDPAGQIEHLVAAYRTDPSTDLRQKLGLAMRTARQAGQERDLLLSVPGDDLTAFEAQRLADLLRQERNFGALENLYRLRAEGDGPDADEAKQLLINFELEAGQSQQAEDLTLRWFDEAHRDQHILETAIPAFVNWGALDEAFALSLSALSVSPKSTYPLIEVFFDGGRQDRALAFQQEWLVETSEIPKDAWPTLIDFAERTGNLAGLRIALVKTPAASPEPDILGTALLQILRYQGVAALNPYASYLRPDVLQAQPLIGAAWTANQGNQIDAATYLLKAQENDLTEWDWNIWGYIAGTLKGSPAYQILLVNVPPNGRAQAVLQGVFLAKL